MLSAMAKTHKPKKPKPPTKQTHQNENRLPHHHHQLKTDNQKLPSWAVVKGLLTCKYVEVEQRPPPVPTPQQIVARKDHKKQQKVSTEQAVGAMEEVSSTGGKRSKKMTSCSGSLCSNTNVMQRPSHETPSFPQVLHRKRISSGSTTTTTTSVVSKNDSCSSSSRSSSRISSSTIQLVSDHSSLEVSKNKNDIHKGLVSNSIRAAPSYSLSTSSSSSYSFKGMGLSKLSGCYECRMVVDSVYGIASTRHSSPRAALFPCPQCGDIFMKPDHLELHQAVNHAVSELAAEDTSKNIVEIIFQSSWLQKQTPICQIDRILKVHNTQKTLSQFEEYRDSIKSKANKQQLLLSKTKHARCIADGNELLRFHCTTLSCSLGLNGSSNLCKSSSSSTDRQELPCHVCDIIRNGFKLGESGILTTGTSGKAHDKVCEGEGEGQKRAMLVCRVISGRVKKNLFLDDQVGSISSSSSSTEEYDSVLGGDTNDHDHVGVYSNLDELYVFDPKAILPCFVVIYGGF